MRYFLQVTVSSRGQRSVVRHEIFQSYSEIVRKEFDTKKGKAVPLQAWSGPEDSRKFRFPDFMTKAQDGGKVVSLKHRTPLPQEIFLVLLSVRG